jgi:N,N-dimethylformamidase beta subunit-like protein
MATESHYLNRRGLACRLLFVVLSAASLAALPATARPLHAAPAADEEELEGRAPTREELRPSVEAAFARESYRPGSVAALRAFNSAGGVKLQVFRIGAERAPTRGSSEMQGVPVTRPRAVGSTRPGRIVRVPVGGWPSGLYFARLAAADGRIGFAPFVVRPRTLGDRRVALVLPTLTWQAYNLRDDDGDGQGDSWYAHWKVHTVRLARPFLNRGVPYNFRLYDLPFLEWLDRTGKDVDVLSDADVEASSARTLARSYDLIVYPGHHEYVTKREYDVVTGYRNRGGNLMFLSANNFFWRVIRHGSSIEKTKRWRDLGRPEAALIGVQYRGNDRGTHRGAWIVRSAPAAQWVFAGTNVKAGAPFGNAGIEIDKTAAASPKGVQVLAEIPNLFGRGFTAQMTYYETRTGAKVFAAGAFTLAGSAREPKVAVALENLWARMAGGDKRLLSAAGKPKPKPAQPGIEAFFGKRSYFAGQTARLVVRNRPRNTIVRLYRAGHGGEGTMQGRQVGRTTRRTALRLGDWPSGLYYARVTAPGGRAGYAPFVLRPRRLGAHRVAVVLPTNTWQAYNFRDDDGDGDEDTWYAGASETSVLLARPFVGGGVPPHYRGYDRGFLRWLALHGKDADFLSDDDLDRVASGDRLARAYDLVVFPGHHEYVTTHEYDVTERYRNLGGNLAFLSANNFFYRVVRRGERIYREGRWRDLGRPEARLVGIQYVDWNQDVYGNKPYTVVGSQHAPWLFRGTGFSNGGSFGTYGIEIDARTASSPRGIRVLCRIPNAFGPGKSAEMTYYETRRGAKVFAAGVINFGGSALWPGVTVMTANLWNKLSRP